MAKKSKTIPKRIAGVKLPKELRRAGDALIEKANSPAGREMLAAGLAMAATAATAAMAKRAQAPVPPRTPTPPETPNAAPPGTHGTPDAQAIADALTGAAEQVLGRLFGKRV